MSNLVTKKIVCAVIAMTLVSAQVSYANSLQDMWLSNVTPGGTIATKNMNGFYGGSATLRTPIVPVTFATFTPPHVAAGCAGADIYMGSFSYINKNQIVSTLKAIMNNAQGLLFQAAIEFVSPMISGLMTKFNDLAQKLNGMQMNSCQIATSMMGDLTKKASAAGESYATELASTGALGDWLTGKTDTANVSPASASALEKDIKWAGNLTWKALKNVKAENQVDMSMFFVPSAPNPQFQREIIMSFLGTDIISVDNSGAANGSQINSPGATNHEPKLYLSSLFKQTGSETKYTCVQPNDVNDECKQVQANDPLIFIDSQLYTKVMLLGDPGWLDPATGLKPAQIRANMDGLLGQPSPNSIVAKITGTSTNGTLTLSQDKFLDVSGAPIVNLIKDLHGTRELVVVKELADILNEYIAYNTVAEFSGAILNAITNFHNAVDSAAGPGNKSSVEFSPEMQGQLKKFVQDRDDLIARRKELQGTLKVAREYVDTIIKERQARLDAVRK